MRPIKEIIIHCSDSWFGDAKTIREWHLAQGWSDIGYHYVILNGKRASKDDYSPFLDGHVETGRRLEVAGAHAKGHNSKSVGICLIGGKKPDGRSSKVGDWLTPKQKQALLELLVSLHERFHPVKIIGHYEVDVAKPCPLLDMEQLRIEFEEFRRTGVCTEA